MPEQKIPITVVDTEPFVRSARTFLTNSEIEDLRDYVSQYRELGEIIEGTGGLQKLRWAPTGSNQGKRGGARVIYYYGGDRIPLYLIATYRKSDKSDMSEPEKKAASKFVALLRAEFAKKRTKVQQSVTVRKTQT